MQNELEQLMTFAHQLAWNAGKLTLRYFQTELDITLKPDTSPVTIADRESEAYIRDVILITYPSHGILGEEYGEIGAGASYRWIIDPIDGTKSFIHGVPLYSVMISLERDGVPVLGVINFPALSEIVYAATGLGCWWNGRAAHVSTISTLKESLVLASRADEYNKRGEQGGYDRLLAAAGMFRTWGDSYGYVLVATGRAEVMHDAHLEVWDAAPVLPILTEAGGTFTDWSGVSTIYGGSGIGTNGSVFAEVMRLIPD